MQKVLLTFIMMFSLGYGPLSYDNEAHEPIVVLELFTSQGCSSCPSADALLHNIKNAYGHKNVIALSYHVEYWNYIGWKDPFSSKTYTDKQRQYAQKFKSNRIYTPQVVVNGREHFVGSSASKMKDALKTYLKTSVANSVALSNVKQDDQSVSFDYSIKGALANKQLRVVLVIDERDTFVKRGENSQRTLKNTNIVVSQKYVNLGNMLGKASISIPETVLKSDDLRLITLVEADNLNITGARQVNL